MYFVEEDEVLPAWKYSVGLRHPRDRAIEIRLQNAQPNQWTDMKWVFGEDYRSVILYQRDGGIFDGKTVVRDYAESFRFRYVDAKQTK